MSLTPCALPGGVWATERVMLHVVATHAAFALGHTEAIQLLRTSSCHFWVLYALCSYFIHLPMKMEPTVSSETSAVRTQTSGNYPKRNKLLHVLLSVTSWQLIPKHVFISTCFALLSDYSSCILNPLSCTEKIIIDLWYTLTFTVEDLSHIFLRSLCRRICKIAESNYWLRRVYPSVRVGLPLYEIFMEYDIWIINVLFIHQLVQ